MDRQVTAIQFDVGMLPESFNDLPEVLLEQP
jgi:hypothetical protein